MTIQTWWGDGDGNSNIWMFNWETMKWVDTESGAATMAKKVRKEPEGVMLSADTTGPLHVELRAHAGMPQTLQVRFDGKVQKMKGIKVKTLVDPRPYGTLVLDFMTAKVKAAKPSGKSKALKGWQRLKPKKTKK